MNFVLFRALLLANFHEKAHSVKADVSPLRGTWFRSEHGGDVRVLGDTPARRISRITGVEIGIEPYHRSNTSYRVSVLLP